MKRLLLITGAGASHDVIDIQNTGLLLNHPYRPPLTKNLFNAFNPKVDSEGEKRGDSKVIQDLLRAYPAVANIALDKIGDERSLENYLSYLKTHDKLSVRNLFWSIPYYLNDLFNSASSLYIPNVNERKDVSNYSRLLRKITVYDIKELIWVNLNYDIFGDFAIQSIVSSPSLNSLESYMNLKTIDNMNIKYCKPHGSVGWWRKINDNKFSKNSIRNNPAILPYDFEDNLSKDIYYEDELRNLHVSPEFWYPAISAPLGEYEFIHSGHKEIIRESIQDITNVLLIGFSALDKDILDLMKEIKSINRLMIVNGSATAYGNETLKRLLNHKIKISLNSTHISNKGVYNGEFSTFLYSDIDKYLNILS